MSLKIQRNIANETQLPWFSAACHEQSRNTLWHIATVAASCHDSRLLRSQAGRKDFTVGAVIFGDAICKVDDFSVRRPTRRCSAAFGIGDQTRGGAICVHDEYLIAVAAAV